VARAKGERAEKIKRERKTRMKRSAREREREGAVAKGGGREAPSEGRKGNRIDK